MEVAGIKEEVSTMDTLMLRLVSLIGLCLFFVLEVKTKGKELIALATKILNCWRGYSDEKAGVLAESDGQPHHTITPIARRKAANLNWIWFFVTIKLLKNTSRRYLPPTQRCSTY